MLTRTPFEFWSHQLCLSLLLVYWLRLTDVGRQRRKRSVQNSFSHLISPLTNGGKVITSPLIVCAPLSSFPYAPRHSTGNQSLLHKCRSLWVLMPRNDLKWLTFTDTRLRGHTHRAAASPITSYLIVGFIKTYEDKTTAKLTCLQWLPSKPLFLANFGVRR